MNERLPGWGRRPRCAGIAAIATVLGSLLAVPVAAGDAVTSGATLRILSGGCVNCHGPGARGAGEIPPLAGRPAEELVRLLEGFRTGGGGVMHRLVDGYSDAELRALADYFSGLEP